jgi:exonuclease III
MRAVLVGLTFLAACTREGVTPQPDAESEFPYPEPRTDVIAAVGSEATLEIATWNIRNFPERAETARLVADVIASLDLDIIVVEEIASDAAWKELLDRLRDHEGVLSTHRYSPDSYQKIGVIYRASLVTVGEPTLLFPTDSFNFPRPPFSLPITVDASTIQLVGIHLKAGRTDEDADRRRAATVTLDAHLRAQVDGGGEAEVVILGDYNERVIDVADREVLAPLLTAPDRYTVRTERPAQLGAISYLGFGGSFIDHITTTAALDARWTAATIQLPRVEAAVPSYSSLVSDHLPIVLVTAR